MKVDKKHKPKSETQTAVLFGSVSRVLEEMPSPFLNVLSSEDLVTQLNINVMNAKTSPKKKYPLTNRV